MFQLFIEGSLEVKLPTMPLWREARFQAKSVKNWWVRNTFGSFDVEKVYAAVARSKFPGQNVQKYSMFSALLEVERLKKWTFPSQKCHRLTGLDHFWKLRCRKSARRCGAKHISKSKVSCFDVEKVYATVARSKFPSQNVQKHTSFSALLEVKRLKKWTPSWREPHFQVNSVKNWRGRNTF